MPQADEIRQFIYAWVEQHAQGLAGPGEGAVPLSDDLNLIGSGLVDSLALLNLIVAIETRFGVELDLWDSDPGEFSTPAGLVGAVLASGGVREQQG